MPYHWSSPGPAEAERYRRDTDAKPPLYLLELWPHQSLGPRGFVSFFTIFAALVAVPLLAVLGSPVLWGLLPFIALTFWGTWLAITHQSRTAARTREEFLIWDNRLQLTHQPGRGTPLTWEANPHWARLTLHDGDDPVPAYLTIKGNGREVQIGTFLSEGERRKLYRELSQRLTELQ